MKRMLSAGIAAILLLPTVKAAETIIPPEALEAEIPSGKYYLQSIVSCPGNSIRLGKAAGARIKAELCIPEHSSGEQLLNISGTAFSAESSATVRLSFRGFHAPGNCSGTSEPDVGKLSFPLRLPTETSGTAQFAFSPPREKLRCQKCGHLLDHCHVMLTLTIDPIPAQANPDLHGFDLSAIRFHTTSPARAITRSATIFSLVRQIAREKEQFARWQQAHQKILKQYPQNNHFDGSAPPSKETDVLRNLPPDEKFRYFTEAELKQLNPQFQIRKLAAWNFYNPEVFWQIPPEINGLAEVSTVFQRNGVLYACAPEQVARWNPTGRSWDFLLDQWSHRPVKSFPEAAGELHISDHKAYRLSDYSEIKLPNSSPHQYAAVGSKLFWIAPGRKKLYCAEAADFSHPRLLNLPLPAPAGARAVELRNLYRGSDGQRLLLEYTVFQENDIASLLQELDVAKETLTCKLPPDAGAGVLQIRENNWSFDSRSGELFDIGENSPLTMVRDARKGSETVALPRLGIDSRQAKFLRTSLRLGVYAATGTHPGGDLVLLNLFSPENSLRLFGLEQRRDLLLNEEGTALLAVMPDGIYELRPKEMPAPPRAATRLAAAPSAPMLKPADIVTEIEEDAPVLFHAERRDGRIFFTCRPVGARTGIRLWLNLPQESQSYLLRFDRPVDRLFDVTIERKNGERDSTVWPDSQTLRISGETEQLFIELPRQENSLQAVLESITPEAQKMKGNQ